MLEQNPLPKTLQTICVSEFQIVHIFKVCYIFIVLYNILHAQQGLGQYPIIDHNISTAKYMKTDPTLEKDYKQLQLSPGVLSCNKLQKKKKLTLASTFKAFWIHFSSSLLPSSK